MKLRSIASIAVLGAVMAASAQDVGSFKGAVITGLTTTGSADLLTWDVALDNGATLELGGTTYDIIDIFGFFNIIRNGTLDPSGSASAPTGWDFKTVPGNDNNTRVAGWTTSPGDPATSHSISGGESAQFVYSTLNPTNNDVFQGYHIRFTDGTNVYTDYVYAVPEPGSMAILGLGAAALLRRRRQKKAA